MFLLSGCFCAAAGVNESAATIQPKTRLLTQPILQEPRRNMCPPISSPPSIAAGLARWNCANSIELCDVRFLARDSKPRVYTYRLPSMHNFDFDTLLAP